VNPAAPGRPLRPHVLQLLATARIGGTERSVVELIRNSEAAACDFTVGLLEAHGPLVSQLEDLGVRVHRWPLWKAAARQLWLGRFLAGFDCVHAYSMRPSLLARFAAWPHRVPVIVGQESVDLSRPSWQFRLEGATSSLVTHYVAKFEAGKQVLIRRAGIPPRRISVVYNGIDVQPFLQGPRRRGTSPVVVSSVANLRPVKRHDRLLCAFALVLDELSPEKRAAGLQLIGEGVCREGLKQLAIDLGISHAVNFLGHRDDVAMLLRASDIVILTSDYEGFPLALLEGMAAGCAVVAPCVGGIPELVTHGQNGLLVDGDVEAYARALLRLCRDADLRYRLGAAAQARVTTCFTSEAMARQLGKVYRDVVLVTHRT